MRLPLANLPHARLHRLSTVRAMKRQRNDIEESRVMIDPEFDQEVAFQEQATDLTIDEIAAMQYEVIDGEDTTLMEGLEGDDSEQDQVPKERRVAILLELLQAQPHELEGKISQFTDEIDADLLELLRQRLETARRFNSDSSLDPASSFAVQRLEDLYRSLKVSTLSIWLIDYTRGLQLPTLQPTFFPKGRSPKERSITRNEAAR